MAKHERKLFMVCLFSLVVVIGLPGPDGACGAGQHRSVGYTNPIVV
jgi:hypothetical protein